MRLQAQTVEEQDTLRELRKALKRGDATHALERHTDETLIQLLRRLTLPIQIVSWVGTIALFSIAILYTGMIFHLLQISAHQVAFLALVFPLGRFVKIKPDVLKAVKLRLEQASLPTLLDADALRILELEATIQKTLSKRLAVAATEDLEALTAHQRKQLLRFTQAQLRMDLTGYHIGKPYFLPEDRAQAATVGFLALASLKQPGAERVSPQRVQTTSSNLKRAIDEYLLVMKARA